MNAVEIQKDFFAKQKTTPLLESYKENLCKLIELRGQYEKLKTQLDAVQESQNVEMLRGSLFSLMASEHHAKNELKNQRRKTTFARRMVREHIQVLRCG